MDALRISKKACKRVLPFGLGLYFAPWAVLAAVGVGLLDFRRNTQRTLGSLDRYFAGNGVFTWLLSPFNLLMDLLCLPYRNEGIYTLDDLPTGYREEIESLVTSAADSQLVAKLEDKLGDAERAMIFFKWYGKNVETTVDVPDFHGDFRYVRTVGVSVFNSRQSTGKHFGPLRVTLRVLINVNDVQSKDAFIQVGSHTHRWAENKIFVFDDTLLHQSVNHTDEPRYCMFVDVLRPSCCPWLLSAILTGVRLVAARFNACFYKHWTMVR